MMRASVHLPFYLLSLLATANAAESPLTIVLIMVDDMGISDLGCFGGEIESPNIDAFATGDVRFSHIHNNLRCCPTRARLLTGLPPHMTGIGQTTGTRFDKGLPDYRRALNRRSITIAEALKSAAYTTLMAGKSHVGERDQEHWLLQRGFDKFYGFTDHANKFVEELSADTRRCRQHADHFSFR